MELLKLTGHVRVSGEHLIVIGHSSTSLTRGLDHGEPVVLQTADGELHAAQVLDIGFTAEDTIYTLEVGARLPRDLAQERIAGLDPERHDLALHEIVDMLGELARNRENCSD